ncbi:hypothetical protein DXG01_011436 [Tephrocybe rancida]|nr:hypothetical protein DXG01_011436 [Tephrocybe rancida]
MPPADNDPTGSTPDGKRPSLGKRFLDRVKGPKSTKSSSASSTPATQLMENQTGPNWPFPAPSAANEEPSLSKRLLAPFKGFNSSAPSTPAAQSVENFAMHLLLKLELTLAPGVVTAAVVPEAAATAQVVNAAGPTLPINVDQGILMTPAAASITSVKNINQHSSITAPAVIPTPTMNINQCGSMTTVPNIVVSQNDPAMNPVSTTNASQFASSGPNVPQDQSKFKEGLRVALDGLSTALRVANESSNWHPILKPVLGGVVAVVDLAKTVSNNSQDMKGKLDHIQGLLPILETSAKHLENRKDGFGKENYLMTFAIKMQTELKRVQQMQLHGLFRRVLQGTKDADTLLGVYKSIGEALEQFESDALDLRACTPGTRVDVLKGILSWLQQSNSEPIYWLTGPAGIGKTTIAKTICELVDDRYDSEDANYSMHHGFSTERYPLVSYFCSHQLDSGESGLLVSTLCRRLCDRSPSYAVCLAEALEKDSELAHATLEVQVKQMLIQPWKAGTSEHVGLSSLIIVVDALDENTKGSVFLQHLLHAVGATRLKGLKFFVTSREDEQISRLCNTLPQGTVLHLQNIQKQTVQNDIGLYLTTSLPDIHVAHQDLLERLTKLSDGLFIYAATVVKMVTANNAAVVEQVEVLQGIVDLSDKLKLDSLYSHIVKNAVSHHKSSIQASRLQVLHTILCAMHPISDIVVAQLAKTTVEVVATVLKNLHAVMYKGHDGMIYTYHASFADYIYQPSTAAETAFDPHCNVGSQHAFLAQRSYEIMEKQLCFNICGLKSSYVKDVDVQDLQECIQDKIDSLLKYAVFTWMAHLNSTTNPGKALLDHPQLFVEKLFLYWVEIVNLLNARREGMQMLDMLRAWIKKAPSSVNDVGFSPDGKQVVSGGDGQSVCIWDALTGDLVKELKVHTAWVLSVAFSPDGKHMVSGTDGKLVHIWDTLSGDLVKELKGHTGSVQSVAFSSDGKQVVSGSDDESVCIWNALTGDLVKELKGHTDSVESVAFSPDGKQVVSGSNDESVHIWDALTGDLVKELKGHTNSVQSVAFSPNGKQVVSGSFDGLVCIWDAWTGDLVEELEGHTGGVCSVAFSPDGKQVVSGSSNKPMHIWDAMTGDIVCELKGHKDWVFSVAFSPDGKQVVSAGDDESVYIWDALTGDLVKELKGHTNFVQAVAFSQDGKHVLSGSNDESVHIWDALTGDLVKELKGHASSVNSVAFSPDGKQVVSGSSDKSVQILDALTGDVVKELKGHRGRVQSVVFSQDGKQVVSGSDDKSVHIWDSLTGDLVKELKGHIHFVLSVAFSPDGKHVVSGSLDNSMHIWDALTGDLVKEFKGHVDWVNSVAFSPDGNQVVSGSSDNSVHILDALTGDLVKELKGHTGWVGSVAFSPDGKHVVSGSSDKSVCIWDAITGDLVKKLKGHTGLLSSVAFSPDGRQVVSGDDDQSVHIWDALIVDLVKELKGHAGAVCSVAFSPDGKQVVSVGEDKSVYIWDALTGDLVKELKGHISTVRSVAFSPDGKQVVSGGNDHSVHIWDALTGDVVKELKGYRGRVWSAVFSPDGKQVVSGSDYKSLGIWNALSGDLVGELRGHTDGVNSVAFSPDGKQVVSGSDDESVHIWDALTGDLVKVLKGHTDSVRSVAFSPDGKQVVSGSMNNSVHIWDSLAGDLVKELKGHIDSVLSVAFSPDGKHVVSGSRDNSVNIWDALTGNLVKELKGHAGSVLSVAFSPSGEQVVSGSADKSVHIWYALTGESIKGQSLAYSSDNSLASQITGSVSDVDLWSIDHQTGWISSHSGHPLLWLPDHMCSAAYTPNTRFIISSQPPTHVVFKSQYVGTSWAKIFPLNI